MVAPLASSLLPAAADLVKSFATGLGHASLARCPNLSCPQVPACPAVVPAQLSCPPLDLEPLARALVRLPPLPTEWILLVLALTFVLGFLTGVVTGCLFVTCGYGDSRESLRLRALPRPGRTLA